MQTILIRLIIFIFFIQINYLKAEDVLLREANKCMRYFSYFEKINKIPANLLFAISLTETGKYHDKIKHKIPWPWTVNVGGKGYYFNTKIEAVSFVRTLQMRGIKSVDVGCMQINLYHHPNAFNNIEQAFEPLNNISYGANFLKNNYNRHSSWLKAIGSYHSETQELGKKYTDIVLKFWDKYQHHGFDYAKIETNTNYNNNLKNISPIKMNRRKSDMMIKVRNNHHYTSQKMHDLSHISKRVINNYNKKNEEK